MFFVDRPNADPDRNLIDRDARLSEFIHIPVIAGLEWPDAVVEDWLLEHGTHEAFRTDYANQDLNGIFWTLDDVSTESLHSIRTGPSEQAFLETVAKQHVHFLGQRPAPVRDSWEIKGTWLTAPLLLDLKLLNSESLGI